MAQRNMVVRLVSWLISLPLTLLIILFAVSNRGPVDIAFWPTTYQITVPIYALALLMIVVGFVLGGSIVWTEATGDRVRARRYRRKSESLEQDLEKAKMRATEAEVALDALPKQERERLMLEAKNPAA